MRKIIIALILIVLIVLTGVVIANGATLGKLEIWGVKAIAEENDVIDSKNEELSSLVSITYPSAVSALESSATTLQQTKSKYEDKVILIGDGSNYLQTEEYEIEFLWTRIGNYANDNDVIIKIEVTSSQISGRYNLNFTVTGNYPDVTQFIYDIENDSDLGFKIEDFSMISDESGVKATFSCTEIKIDLDTIDAAGQDTITTEETDTSETGSTTNTTDTTNTTTDTTDATNTADNTDETENTDTTSTTEE